MGYAFVQKEHDIFYLNENPTDRLRFMNYCEKIEPVDIDSFKFRMDYVNSIYQLAWAVASKGFQEENKYIRFASMAYHSLYYLISKKSRDIQFNTFLGDMNEEKTLQVIKSAKSRIS